MAFRNARRGWAIDWLGFTILRSRDAGARWRVEFRLKGDSADEPLKAIAAPTGGVWAVGQASDEAPLIMHAAE